jgi:hypothetical protein
MRPELGVNHPPLSIAEIKERVDLYLGFFSGPSWPLVQKFIFSLFYPYIISSRSVDSVGLQLYLLVELSVNIFVAILVLSHTFLFTILLSWSVCSQTLAKLSCLAYFNHCPQRNFSFLSSTFFFSLHFQRLFLVTPSRRPSRIVSLAFDQVSGVGPRTSMWISRCFDLRFSCHL